MISQVKVGAAQASEGEQSRDRHRDAKVALFSQILLHDERRMVAHIVGELESSLPLSAAVVLGPHVAASVQALVEALVRDVEVNGWTAPVAPRVRSADPLLTFVTVEAMLRAAQGIDAKGFRRLIALYHEGVKRTIYDCDTDWPSARFFYDVVNAAFERLATSISDDWFEADDGAATRSTRRRFPVVRSVAGDTGPTPPIPGGSDMTPVLVVDADGAVEHANAAAVREFCLPTTHGVPLRPTSGDVGGAFLSGAIGAFLRSGTPQFRLVWPLSTPGGRHEFRIQFKRRYAHDGACAGATLALLDLEAMSRVA